LESLVTEFAEINSASVKNDLATTLSTTTHSQGGVFEHRVAILNGIFAFVGIFVLLFGTYLGVYTYKQCCRKSAQSEQFVTTNQSQCGRYIGLARQTRKENTENLSTDSMYLDPVCDRRSHRVQTGSDDVEIQLSVVEQTLQSWECNSVSDDSEYLSPNIKDSHTYVEILENTNSL
jgi:hypothetical protein